MADRTRIEWTEATWSPIKGCSKVSVGCHHCYAERFAARFSGPGLPYEGFAEFSWGGTPHWTEKVALNPHVLHKPTHWRKPRMVFVNSMSDLFHSKVSDYEIVRVFNVMTSCERHTFQVLTKRPKRMRDFMQRYYQNVRPNIWLGVSVENQEMAEQRIPFLLDTPAALRFVSCEPLLGPINMSEVCSLVYPSSAKSVITGNTLHPRIDWLICGEESGPGARPMYTEWACDLRDWCQSVRVPFFMKQVCEDGRKIPFEQWPWFLKVRQFPEVKR